MKNMFLPLTDESQETFDQLVTGHLLWGRMESVVSLDALAAEFLAITELWQKPHSLASLIGRGHEFYTLRRIWGTWKDDRGAITTWREKALATKGLADLMEERWERWNNE